MNNLIGVLQGRLTPSRGRGIQFFPGEPGEWKAEFPAAAIIGLEAIELLVRPNSLYQHPLMSLRGQKKLLELSKSNNIAIPSVHAYYAKTDTYEKDLVEIVRASHALGANVILLSFFKDRKLSEKQDDTWEDMRERCAPAAQTAQELGVQLGIEAELSASTLRELFSYLGSPAYGVYYDLGNQFACGFPVVEEIKTLGEHIVGVHVKDRLSQKSGELESPSVPLGEGCADLLGAFRSLAGVQYKHPLIIQGARVEGANDITLVGSYAKKMRELLQNV